VVAGIDSTVFPLPTDSPNLHDALARSARVRCYLSRPARRGDTEQDIPLAGRPRNGRSNTLSCHSPLPPAVTAPHRVVNATRLESRSLFGRRPTLSFARCWLSAADPPIVRRTSACRRRSVPLVGLDHADHGPPRVASRSAASVPPPFPSTAASARFRSLQTRLSLLHAARLTACRRMPRDSHDRFHSMRKAELGHPSLCRQVRLFWITDLASVDASATARPIRRRSRLARR